MDHVKNLEEVRKQLISRRRTTAKSLADDYERGRTEGLMREGHIETLVKIQQEIEAIDQAIKDEQDEQRIAPAKKTRASSEDAPGWTSELDEIGG